MKKENLAAIVEKAGLDASESRVYVAAVSLGKAAVNDLAKEAGLNRTSCYAVVERLKQKGLMSEVKNGRKVLVIPSSPDTLLDIQKENFNLLQKHIGDLKQSFAMAKAEPGAQLFEGTEGLKSVLNLIAKEAKEVSIFGDGDAFQAAIPGWTEDYSEKRLENNVRTRILLRGTDLAIAAAKKIRKSGDAKAKLTEIRVLPAAYAIVGGFDVFGGRAVFYSFDKQNVAVMIENKIIAKMMQTVFDILWTIAEQYNTTLLR